MSLERRVPPKRGSERDEQAYKVWNAMVYRCHSPGNVGYKSYGAKGVKVCDEWMDFRIFEKWYVDHKNKFLVGEKVHVDKDLLVKGNKIYGPKTCVLLPQKMNIILSTSVWLQPHSLNKLIKLCWEYKDSLDIRVFPAISRVLKEHDIYMVNGGGAEHLMWYMRYFMNTKVILRDVGNGFHEVEYETIQ